VSRVYKVNKVSKDLKVLRVYRVCKVSKDHKVLRAFKVSKAVTGTLVAQHLIIHSKQL